MFIYINIYDIYAYKLYKYIYKLYKILNLK